MSRLVVSAKQRHRIVGMAVSILIALVAFVAVPGSGGATVSAADISSTRFALFDGTEASLADFVGRPLVVNFWASWCPACVGELPEIQAVHEQLGDEVTILGIANADERGAAVALADTVGLTYELADDPDGELFRELGLIAMPSTIFITADGEISEVFGGRLDEDGLLSRIEPLGVSS